MTRTQASASLAIAAAVAVLPGLGVMVAPVASAEVRTPLANGLTVILQDPGPDGNRSVRTQGVPRVGDYVTQVINVRFPDGNQFERPIDASNQLSDTFILSRNQTDVSVQACRPRTLASSLCTGWGAFKNEVPAEAPKPADNPPVQCPADSPVKTVPAGQTCPAAPPPVQCPPDSPVKTVPAGQTCPAAPLVTDAISLSFSPPGFGNITATVSNSSALNGKCTYDATPGNTHRDFNVPAHGSTPLTFNGFNTGTSYHATVTCTDSSGKQTQPIGSDSKDVRF